MIGQTPPPLATNLSTNTPVNNRTSENEKNNPIALRKLGNNYRFGNGVPQDFNEAMRCYQAAAEKGDALAFFNIGVFYHHGLGVTQDYQEAMRCYKAASDRGNAAALVNIGVLYGDGLGVTQDYQEAMRCYKVAADKGNAAAFVNLGLLYQYGRGVAQDYQEAMRCYKAAADKGNAAAFFNIGCLYAHGLGVTPDYQEAMRCFQVAADKGNANAFFNIGCLYAHGLGVTQDYQEAMTCFKAAAKKGMASAFTCMGVLYKLGLGVNQDFKEAMTCFKAGAEKGFASAWFYIGILHRDGLGVEQSEQEAGQCVKTAVSLGSPDDPKNIDEFLETQLSKGLSYLEKKQYAAAYVYFLFLAQVNNAEALCQLGLLYQHGHGVKQDFRTAMVHYKKALELKSVMAAKHIEKLTEAILVMALRDLEKKDYVAAVDKLLFVAEEKNEFGAEAQFQFGKMYLEGLGLKKKNPQGAINHFKNADNIGHFKAPFMVAESYMAIDYYFSRDKRHLAEAIVWYKKASDKGDDQAQSRLFDLSEQYRNGIFSDQDDLNVADDLLTFLVNAKYPDAVKKHQELKQVKKDHPSFDWNALKEYLSSGEKKAVAELIGEDENEKY